MTTLILNLNLKPDAEALCPQQGPGGRRRAPPVRVDVDSDSSACAFGAGSLSSLHDNCRRGEREE